MPTSPARPSVEVVTPLGPARIVADLAPMGRRTLILGHGAGGGIEARDLVALASTLPALGTHVLRVEQPWRVAGGRVAPAPPRLDVGWLAALEGLARARPDWLAPDVLVGGRSAGARVACRTAEATGARGVVALAFPLHPPGRPALTRLGELETAGVPVLVVQGDRDPFGRAADFPPSVDLRPVPYADHSFGVAKGGPITQREAMELLTLAVANWLTRLTDGSSRSRGMDD